MVTLPKQLTPPAVLMTAKGFRRELSRKTGGETVVMCVCVAVCARVIYKSGKKIDTHHIPKRDPTAAPADRKDSP